jgi:26S proteasome regulatory subunit N1
MGKGLLTLNPYHSDGLLFNKTALAGILVVMFSALDMKNSTFMLFERSCWLSSSSCFLPGLLSKRHYLLYSLVTAIRPRVLITVDEDLTPVPVSVRVGTAVDVAGVAGK